MPTILRSSAVGKLKDGSTTTVPSPRSSGSLAGYRAAKVRCNSSEGAIGGADHIAKDNQSVGVRASPEFPGSSFSAGSTDPRLPGGAGCRHHGGDDAGGLLLRGGRRRADLPAAGRRLLTARGPPPRARAPLLPQ